VNQAPRHLCNARDAARRRKTLPVVIHLERPYLQALKATK
jgi:hypothetical protein